MSARQFRHGFGIMPAFQFLRRGVQQARGGAVDDGDVAVAVQADHAGADARQHGLGEAAAFIVQPVGGHQIGALGGELLGHAVEGVAQIGDFVVVRATFTCAVRSPSETRSAALDQIGDRPHQPVGGPDAGPDRAPAA